MTILFLSRLHPLLRRAAVLVSGLTLLSALAACGDSGRATNPQPVPVASVRIAPLTGVLLVGAEHAMQASPLSAAGAELPNRVVTWSSDNLVVATVSATGVVTARAEGIAGISASSEGKTSRIEVRIVSPNPLPVITAITPSTIAAGSVGPVQVDVTGSGFTADTRLRLNGTEQTTQRIDGTHLRMMLSTAALESAATWSVTAATPAPGGGISNTIVLTVEAIAAPTITAIDPRQITAGWSGAFTLTISGTGFTARSEVSWDGGARAARFVDAATLQITIDPQDVRVARTVPLVVTTPAPGGGSAATTFTVNPVPVASVTVQSPWGFAWTWRDHRLPLTALAEDHLGRALTDRRATWTAIDASIATVAPVGDREVAVYGLRAGETDVEATVDGVRARRTVRVHETPAYEIVYEAGEGDDRHLLLWDLVTANAPRRLAIPMVAYSPAPSPDGSEVAFVGVAKGAGPTGNADLFIVNRSGAVRRIAPSPGFEADPAWSPDATKLAFTSNRARGSLDVFVADLASGVIVQLTQADPVAGAPGSGTAARAPAWSPDGTQIAYTVQAASGSQLWIMSADGSNKRQLTDGASASDFDPVWSPDGSVIAFMREFHQPQLATVMTVRPDGSQVGYIGGRIVNVAATPAYSPDGLWLTTAQTRGSGAGAIHAFSTELIAGPRIVMPVELGGGRHARWMRRP